MNNRVCLGTILTAFQSTLSLVHTSDISTRSIRKQSRIYPLGLVDTKREFFFVSSFDLLLAYDWIDCIPLFCLLFVLMLMSLV